LTRIDSLFSDIQRDAINAAVGTLRFQSPETNSFGTRQTDSHTRAPSYAAYLKDMMSKYATAIPGYGIGSVPLQHMQAMAAFNPFLSASPDKLGSGVDLLGYKSVNAPIITDCVIA
jgi:hypothetical protein